MGFYGPSMAFDALLVGVLRTSPPQHHPILTITPKYSPDAPNAMEDVRTIFTNA